MIEQELGHKTHAMNLRSIFEREPGFETRWILPEMRAAGVGAKLPLVGGNWTVQAGLQTRRGLARLSRATRLDGIFFHTQVTAVLATDWVRRYPSVISLDATPIQYDELGQAYDHQRGPDWLEDLKLRQYKACFQAARHLVTWSQWAKDGLAADYGVSPEKVTVIPPGVDVRQWARPERGVKDPGTVKILFVGGNLERKGGFELLEAFRNLQDEHRSNGARLELHLVTKDPAPERPGVIAHYGMKANTPELKELYFASDIFCLPTHGDCLPMALAEAGAAGLPIVSTRVAAIPELVVDQDNGYLVEPRDGKCLAAALGRLVSDPALRARMGARSKEIVWSGHNLERNARQLAGLLENIIRESKGETNP